VLKPSSERACFFLFSQQGAKFSAEDQAKYAKITEKLAELCTVFTQVIS